MRKVRFLIPTADFRLKSEVTGETGSSQNTRYTSLLRRNGHFYGNIRKFNMKSFTSGFIIVKQMKPEVPVSQSDEII